MDVVQVCSSSGGTCIISIEYWEFNMTIKKSSTWEAGDRIVRYWIQMVPVMGLVQGIQSDCQFPFCPLVKPRY